MFGSSGANAYAKVGIETGVIAASPHRLIVMLFEGALLAVANAKLAIGEKDTPKKGKSISKAIDIVDNGLKASLNKDQGGEIAANLDNLYTYISGLLFSANLHNRVDQLDEVSKLLSELKEAWIQIDTVKGAA